MEENYQVELELSVARRWLLDGNIKRAWLHLGLAKYYHLQEDIAAEHSVHPTASGAGWRARLAHLLITWAYRLIQSGGG